MLGYDGYVPQRESRVVEDVQTSHNAYSETNNINIFVIINSSDFYIHLLIYKINKALYDVLYIHSRVQA